MPADRYHPRPVDTSRVELPAEVMAVVERLARNVHEAWARERIADGWRWGPVRDDQDRRHPSLVPYEDLGEEERKYDRITVGETLKVLCALGFRITGPGSPGEAPPR
jgi:hypothetical protein